MKISEKYFSEKEGFKEAFLMKFSAARDMVKILLVEVNWSLPERHSSFVEIQFLKIRNLIRKDGSGSRNYLLRQNYVYSGAPQIAVELIDVRGSTAFVSFGGSYDSLKFDFEEIVVTENICVAKDLGDNKFEYRDINTGEVIGEF